MKIYLSDGDTVETNEELVLSTIQEYDEHNNDYYPSYEFHVSDIDGTYWCIFVNQIVKITA